MQNDDVILNPIERKPLRLSRWVCGLIALTICCAAIVGLILLLPYLDQIKGYVRNVIEWVGSLGFWGPLVFIILFVVSAVICLPASILTASAGTLFGLKMGVLYVSIASTVAAIISFLIARYAARDWVEEKVSKNAKFSAIDNVIGKQAWKIIGLTRLSPIIPFPLMNYGFGVTKVKLSHYIIASWIGMIPGTILFVYIGAVGKAAVGSEVKSATEWLFYGVGLIATVVVTVYITKISKKALRKELENPTD